MKCQEKAELVAAYITVLIIAVMFTFIDWRIGAFVLGVTVYVHMMVSFFGWCSNFLHYNPTFRSWLCKDTSK